MPDAPAPPPAPPANSFLYLFLFMMLFMVIIIFPDLYLGLGRATGSVLAPLIGFGGEMPAATLVLAALLTGVATTYLRHVFTDWVAMAKVQETMRAFNQEFKKARLDKNHHKIKKLTERQGDIFKLQAEASGGQFKPMMVTMIVVIPLFAWLLTFFTAAIPYDVDATGESLLVTRGGTEGVHFLGAGASPTFQAVQRTDVSAWALAPDAAVLVRGGGQTARLGPPSALDRSAHEVGTLARGFHNLSASGALQTPAGPAGVVVLLFAADGYRHAVRTDQVSFVELARNATVYAFVLSPSATASGEIVVAAGGTNWTLSAAHAIAPAQSAHAAVTPHRASVPWNPEWDLTGVWIFLPRWIILYSLFSFPGGQLLARALKARDLGKAGRAAQPAAG
ncbi:MAG TPA: EMC3/TMCO1 family protein [Candidatus Thermoplasmatota archaeon]|nr:EMC3/TMCO1 family protein [Candidatus Thermoplasmatota archaeon]